MWEVTGWNLEEFGVIMIKYIVRNYQSADKILFKVFNL